MMQRRSFFIVLNDSFRRYNKDPARIIRPYTCRLYSCGAPRSRDNRLIDHVSPIISDVHIKMDVRTVELARKELYCSHCRRILKDAVQTENGTRLCEKCFQEISS